MLLLPLLSMLQLAVYVAGLPTTPTTACDGHACTTSLVEDLQHTPPHLNAENANFTVTSHTPAALEAELPLEKQVLDSQHGTKLYPGTSEDVVEEMYVFEHPRELLLDALDTFIAQLLIPRDFEAQAAALTEAVLYMQDRMKKFNAMREADSKTNNTWSSRITQESLLDIDYALEDLKSDLQHLMFKFKNSTEESINKRVSRDANSGEVFLNLIAIPEFILTLTNFILTVVNSLI